MTVSSTRAYIVSRGKGAADDYAAGQSEDDTGTGDLDKRTVIAINLEAWEPGEDGTGLEGFP